MRYGFATCVQLGLSCLDELISLSLPPSLLITLRDHDAQSKSGRVYLDQLACDQGVELVKVANINDPHALNAIRSSRLDWLFIIGWSQIARAEILQLPRRGVIGIHPTLLPEGRGRAPIPWAILKSLTVTGVTMFQLDEGIDSGPIIDSIELPVAGDETATSLYDRVNTAHRTLIRQAVTKLRDPEFVPTPQDSTRATEWPARTPADGEINFHMSVADALRMVRATSHPYPGAFIRLGETLTLRLWSAAAGGHASLPTLNLADGPIHATEYDYEGNR